MSVMPAPPLRYLPIMARLDDSAVLVTGGGNIATSKIRSLLANGARVDVIARELGATLAQWAEEGRIRRVGQDIDLEQLEELLPSYRLLYAATDDRQLNRAIAARARRLNILVCAVDDPESSSFITPATISRGPVQVAVSTSAGAPVLARRLREKIEALLPAQLAELALFMKQKRARLFSLYPTAARRRQIWEHFLDHLPALHTEKSRNTALQAALNNRPPRGEVWLVGAGPGDPDLLTLHALHAMQNADSVLYDHLLGEGILSRIRRDAEHVFVGKQRQNHSMPQEQINAELIRRARRGERVLRLKGGDPLIFGRGGEEAEALQRAGIPFRIIPGVTAATACAAYGGIPLTHRDCAQACLFVTGHPRRDGTLDLPWEALTQRNQTVVIYMGLGSVAQLCRSMIEHNLPQEWPAAIIAHASLPTQRTIIGTLADLPEKLAQQPLSSPATLIIGQVVHHRISPLPAQD